MHALMHANSPRADSAGSFEQHLRTVMAPVRRSFIDVLEAVGGHTPHTKGVCDALGVYRSLGWQISKVACEPELAQAARHIPEDGGMRSFIAAARKRGVPDEKIQAVSHAIEAFDRFVHMHADDRPSLDVLLSAAMSKPDESALLAARKTAFQGASAVFGVQARAQFTMLLVGPSASGDGWCDLATVRGFVGFRRNRADTSWVVAMTRVEEPVGTAQDRRPQRIFPPAPEAHLDGVPLLEPFCSRPLAQFQRHRDINGWIIDELVAGPIGNTAATTFFTAEIIPRCFRALVGAPDEKIKLHLSLHTPCEGIVFDQFIHRSISPPTPREMSVFARLPHVSIFRKGAQLPIVERIESPGVGLGFVPTPEIPGYADAIEHVCRQLGWPADEFELHRARMKYPPMPSELEISYLAR